VDVKRVGREQRTGQWGTRWLITGIEREASPGAPLASARRGWWLTAHGALSEATLRCQRL